MIKTRKFFLFVLILLFILIFTSVLYFSNVFSFSQFISIILALGITAVNFLAQFLSAKTSLKKSDSGFLKIVFGSMLIRFFSLLLMILISLIFLDINKNSFIFSIFIFYILFLFIEIYYLNFQKNNNF
jgi:hypothetical protein